MRQAVWQCKEGARLAVIGKRLGCLPHGTSEATKSSESTAGSRKWAGVRDSGKLGAATAHPTDPRNGHGGDLHPLHHAHKGHRRSAFGAEEP